MDRESRTPNIRYFTKAGVRTRSQGMNCGPLDSGFQLTVLWYRVFQFPDFRNQSPDFSAPVTGLQRWLKTGNGDTAIRIPDYRHPETGKFGIE